MRLLRFILQVNDSIPPTLEAVMKRYFEQLLRLMLITVTGTAGSVVIGLLIYGKGVFDPATIGFAFVSFGFSGGFIFAFYNVRGLSDTITAAVVLSVIQFVAASAWFPLLNAGIWSFGVNMPVVALAFVFERKLAALKQLKFVVVGIVYAAMFVLLTLVVGVLTGVETLPASVFQSNFLDGLLIGIGLGLGVEGAESFIHSIEHHRTVKAQASFKKQA
jgi:hypothetical protein